MHRILQRLVEGRHGRLLQFRHARLSSPKRGRSRAQTLMASRHFLNGPPSSLRRHQMPYGIHRETEATWDPVIVPPASVASNSKHVCTDSPLSAVLKPKLPQPNAVVIDTVRLNRSA